MSKEKKIKTETSDQTVEKSKSIKKSTYSKKKESKKNYFEWYCLCAVNFQ